MMFLKFMFAVILVEALTELLTKSEIFSPVREFFFNRRHNRISGFINRMLECGYCTSVWVGWFVATMFCWDLLFNIFFGGVVLHRAANLTHFFIDRINKDDFEDI